MKNNLSMILFGVFIIVVITAMFWGRQHDNTTEVEVLSFPNPEEVKAEVEAKVEEVIEAVEEVKEVIEDKVEVIIPVEEPTVEPVEEPVAPVEVPEPSDSTKVEGEPNAEDK
tara:strand:- start:2774 stop:3109 length:336 start_codon:yes stop_codon:yes gene_type:complete